MYNFHVLFLKFRNFANKNLVRFALRLLRALRDKV